MDNLNTNGLGLCFKCLYKNTDAEFISIFSDEYESLKCLYSEKHVEKTRESLIQCKYYKIYKSKQKVSLFRKLLKPIISWLYDQLIERK